MRVRVFVSAIGCTLLLGGLTESTPLASSAPSTDTVPLFLRDNRMPVIPVSINTSGPYRFLLDTGSNWSGVSASLAARLGLLKAGTTTAIAVTGTIPKDVTVLNEVSVGSRRASQLPVLVLADEQLKRLGVDGLLGQDFLIHQSYTVDFQRSRLQWLPECETGSATTRGAHIPLRRALGLWLAELPQNDRGTEIVWLVPDTGAQTLVLFEANMPASLRLSPVPDVLTSTLAGTSFAGAARVRQLRVGPVIHFDEPAVIIRQRRLDPDEGHGLLPLSQYASVTFNARARYMQIEQR